MPDISVNGYGQIFDLESGAELCTTCNDPFEDGLEPYGRSRSGKGICHDCAMDNWSLCYSCDVFVLDRYFNTDMDSCQGCVNLYYFECEQCNDMISNDYYYCDGMCESCNDMINDNEREGVRGYHSGAPWGLVFHSASGVVHAGSHDTKLVYYGIEFECEDVGRDYLDSLTMLEDGRYAHAEHDSSLSNGFEVISQPATALQWLHGDVGRALRRFHTHMVDNGATFDHPNVGAHVHVSRTIFGNGRGDSNHLSRFVIFGTHNEQFMRALSGRGHHDSYAHLNKYEPKTLHRAIKQGRDDRSRWCNLTNDHGTIEIRLFRGSDNFTDYLAYIDMVRALANYTRELTANDCLYGALLSQSFVQWLADSSHRLAYQLVLDRVPVSQLM